MSKKSFVKNLTIAAAIFAAAEFMGAQPANAEADSKINLDAKIAVEDSQKPISQTMFSSGDNRLMIETIGNSENYAINIEDSKGRVNVSSIDGYGQRMFAAKNTADGFFGAEYQSLQGDNRLGFSGSARLSRKTDIEANFDNEGNAKGIVFHNTGKTAMIGIGGGKGNHTSEANISYSHKSTADSGIGYHARLVNRGHGDNISDIRVRLGPTISWQKARVLGICDSCFNTVSAIGDVSAPSNLGEFDFYSADACSAGGKKGDIGLDIRVIESVRKYINIAVNLGDYGNFKDLTFSPEVHKIANGPEGYRAGLSAYLGNAKIWYQGTFNEGSKANHKLMVGMQKKL